MRIHLAGPPNADLAEVARWLTARGHDVRRGGEPSPAEEGPAVAMVDCRGAPAGLSRWTHIGPVVALSDDDRPESTVALLAAGASDVLPMPVDTPRWGRRLAVIEAMAAREHAARLARAAAVATIAALREESQKFSLVSRATHDCVYDWAIGTGTLVWNEAMDTLFGHSPHAGLRSLDWWSAQIHPDDRDRVSAGLDAAMAQGDQVWSDEYRFRRGDGSWAHVLDRGTVMFDERGRATRMIGVMTDISPLRELQAHLVLADRMASVGTLAAGVAHEINNPLTWLGARIATAQETVAALSPGPTARELGEALADASEGARRIRDIVKDLRLFSRAEDDVSSPLDVRRVVEAALGLAAADIRQRARLTRDLRPVPPVRANEARLGQVVLNLVLNAVQAVPEGSPEVQSIRVITGVRGGEVFLSVSDSGVGMTPEVQRRIFDAFFTTKPIGEGTGLGLAISRQLVARMGGRIEVESEPGRGSTFTVLLPATDAPAAAAPAPAPAAVVAPRERGRVLVIDDEALIVSFLEGVLGTDHEVVGHTRSPDALALLRAGADFDVILCDLMMPELTGEQIHAALRAERPELLERLVFITGGAFTTQARAFLSQPGMTVVEKPFELRPLRAMIGERVRQRRGG